MVQAHFTPCSLKLPCPSVVILDDNFHLRSMRYQYYQIARKCEGLVVLLYAQYSHKPVNLSKGLACRLILGEFLPFFLARPTWIC